MWKSQEYTIKDDCEPRINNVGSGASNVGRRHAPESMIMGQKGCSIASRVFFHCERLQLPARQSLTPPGDRALPPLNVRGIAVHLRGFWPVARLSMNPELRVIPGSRVGAFGLQTTRTALSGQLWTGNNQRKAL